MQLRAVETAGPRTRPIFRQPTNIRTVDRVRAYLESGAGLEEALDTGALSADDVRGALETLVAADVQAPVSMDDPGSDETGTLGRGGEAAGGLRNIVEVLVKEGAKLSRPFKVRVASGLALELQRQLFRLGCGYFNGNRLYQDVNNRWPLCGIGVSKRGRMTLFVGGHDERNFDSCLAREISVDTVLGAASLDDLDELEPLDQEESETEPSVARPRAA